MWSILVAMSWVTWDTLLGPPGRVSQFPLSCFAGEMLEGPFRCCRDNNGADSKAGMCGRSDAERSPAPGCF